MLTVAELQALAEIRAAQTVSIYMPTMVRGVETRQNAVRARNLLDEASRRLHEAGWRSPGIEELLEPGRALERDEVFWQHQTEGLAMLAAPGFFRAERLPFAVGEQAVVAPRLHLKPLLKLVIDPVRFHVLTVDSRGARLFDCGRFACHAVEDGLPEGVASVARVTEYEGGRQAAPPARPRSGAPVGMPETQAFGETPEAQRKTQLVEYLRHLAKAVADRLGGTQQPLVLVALPEVQGHFRQLAHGLSLLEEGIDADPSSLDVVELHERALALVRPRLDAAQGEAVDRLRARLGSGDGAMSTVPVEIVEAAGEGRVDTLLLAEGEHLWARPSEPLAAHGHAVADDVDLLDVAALRTLAQGGRVELVPKAALPPSGRLMAAILRY